MSWSHKGTCGVATLPVQKHQYYLKLLKKPYLKIVAERQCT
jgi:hypothetical protein